MLPAYSVAHSTMMVESMEPPMVHSHALLTMRDEAATKAAAPRMPDLTLKRDNLAMWP